MRALALFAFLCGCNSIPRIPVEGRVGLESVQTTVDSELARYFIENSPSRSGARPELDAEIARLLARYDSAPLSRDSLRALSDEASPDFAAVYFVRRLLSVPRHRRMQERFMAHVARFREQRARGVVRIDSKGADDYVTVFVPGLLYESKTETKGDMAEPRALLRQAGLGTAFIRVREAGTVEVNGEHIAAELRALRAAGKKVVLVSTSKGGPDVAYAIGSVMAAEDRDFIRGWVSIGGVLRGTEFIDANMTWPKRWIAAVVGWIIGIPLDTMKSMSAERSLQRFAGQSLPGHLTVLHFVAVPLSGTVLPQVQRTYSAMRKFGPNDGMTLLSNQLLPGGHIVLAVGLDHWFRDPEIDLKTLALAQTIIDLLRE